MRSDLLFPANRDLLAEAERLGPALEEGQELEGLIHPREGLLLYLLARRSAHIGHVVEIGAYKARSTWYIAQGLRDAGSPYRVVSIDPHEDAGQREQYFANLERHGLMDMVDPRVGFSHDLLADVEGPVGMLWIDGDHSYASVRQDFDDWFPRLERGGAYAMHDTVNAWHGPTKLARELLGHRSDLADIGVMWLILYARKVAPALTRRVSGLSARLKFEALTLAQARHHGLGPQAILPGES